MKKLLFAISITAIMATTSCSSSSQIKPLPYLHNGQEWDKSIIILGDWDDNPETPYTYLHWAPVNVGYDSSGELASKDDHRVGRLFQWGSGDSNTNKVAKERYFNEVKPKFWYTKADIESHFTGDLWNNAHGPCPEGWRLPTPTEFKKLIAGKHGGYGWCTSGHYAGYDSYKGAEFFGMNDELTPGAGVFLPAAGNISGSYGGASAFGEMGAYWSSEAESIERKAFDDRPRAQASALIFAEESCDIQKVRHACGFSIRCVHDVN